MVRNTMDFFEHRYYRTNKILMTIIGQWPYQNSRASRGFLAVLLFLSISQIVPQILAIVKYHDDWEFLLECVAPLLVEVACTTKLICSIQNSQKMLMMLNRIRADWQVAVQDRDVNILHAYAKLGRKMTIMYAVTIYVVGILFITQPIIPAIIDVFLMNGSRPREFPFPVYYYNFDAQKYYFYIIMYSYPCVSMGLLVIIAYDTMFIVYIQHCCGTFAVLGHKLERTAKNEKLTEIRETRYYHEIKDTIFERLVSCVKRHNDAIEFAELIEATYSWCLFFTMGINVVGFSVLGIQIVKRSNNYEGLVRFVVWLLGGVVNLYLYNYMSQVLMDRSISIRYHIYNSKWYRLSPKVLRIVRFMMMRCNVSCNLTAGRMSMMSVRTFGVFLKSSMSYFTLLRSI